MAGVFSQTNLIIDQSYWFFGAAFCIEARKEVGFYTYFTETGLHNKENENMFPCCIIMNEIFVKLCT